MTHTPPTHRKIIHIDMDAFYASVEQRDHPEYQGQPIVVGGRPESRGAVAAASYEARRFGVHSAMPARTAIQRCPHLIFVSPRFDVYRQVSQQIRTIFHRYTDLVEPLSLDEAYLDVTVNKANMKSAGAIARRIKQQIWDQTHLTASAGVSVNKFLAKIASDLDKPDGFYLIPPDQAETFVATLPIAKFYGIGKVTATKMESLGIHTGADLKQWSEADLVKRFGKVGRFYYQVARGQDHRPVNPNRIRKSVGAETSFAQDLDQVAHMETALQDLAQQVQDRLARHQQSGLTLTLKIKYADYRQITRSRTLAYPLRRVSEIFDLAQALLQETLSSSANQKIADHSLGTHQIPEQRTSKVRLLGITISNLQAQDKPQYVQLSLAI